MALIEMVMPKMGESIMEGTILNWLKKEGDKIEQDESVLEVATDKVDTEVPATHAGILQKILAEAGDVVEVGKPIAVIATGADAQSAPLTDKPAAPELVEEAHASVLESQISNLGQDHGVRRLSQPAQGRFYSPLVLTIAREEKISMQELEYIPGTGGDNRVTKKDILNYVAGRNSSNGSQQATAPAAENFSPKAPVAETVVQPVVDKQVQTSSNGNNPSQPPVAEPQAETPRIQVQENNRNAPVRPEEPSQPSQPTYTPSAPTQPVSPPAVSYNGRAEIVEMDRMRKIIAQRMVDSKRISPHVTSFVEADVTNLVFWRNRIKNEFKAREGDTITYTPVFIEAITRAIKDYPMINVSVEGDRIIVKKDINIGMAVALPSGNLIVPVIKGADQLNMVGLTRKVNELARRARENKLSPDDLSEGTFTMSNVGSFGNVMGTPIIVQPQVGIMAFGAIQKKPAVIETPFGDTLGIRHMMFLSHSYDHRVVDGALGGMFVRRVADYLEAFDVNRKVF
jgi:2-oxoglutarate dehydrogenase E2 component (dihydrolipoamide succinyltransferase)